MHNLAILAREIYSSIYMYVTNVRQSVRKNQAAAFTLRETHSIMRSHKWRWEETYQRTLRCRMLSVRSVGSVGSVGSVRTIGSVCHPSGILYVLFVGWVHHVGWLGITLYPNFDCFIATRQFTKRALTRCWRLRKFPLCNFDRDVRANRFESTTSTSWMCPARARYRRE